MAEVVRMCRPTGASLSHGPVRALSNYWFWSTLIKRKDWVLSGGMCWYNQPLLEDPRSSALAPGLHTLPGPLKLCSKPPRGGSVTTESGAQLLNRMTVGFSFQPGILLRVNYYIKHQLRPSQAKKGRWSYPSIATLHSPPIPAYERISPHHIGYSLRWLTITHNVLCLRTFLRNILALLIDLGSHETHWLDHSLTPGHGSVSICCIPGTGNTGL